MVRFPNIEQITEPSDRELRLEAARAAVEHLKTLTDSYRESVKTREQAEVAREAYLAQQQSLRQFADDVESLRQQFMGLHASDQPHDRGIQFERLLTDLCVLFDMEPRLAYSLSNEQLDGSLSYDTDDYIVEARWRAEPTDRGDLDIFAAKVRRKGKNALGLFVSLNGFTAAALDCYREATPFLAVDGADLFHVFEGRLRWDDLLRAKKRHANETGNCMLSAVTMMSE
jgi:Restriction endonuclease